MNGILERSGVTRGNRHPPCSPPHRENGASPARLTKPRTANCSFQGLRGCGTASVKATEAGWLAVVFSGLLGRALKAADRNQSSGPFPSPAVTLADGLGVGGFGSSRPKQLQSEGGGGAGEEGCGDDTYGVMPGYGSYTRADG
ncbi:hypothetical protein SKAU_G00348120 [Synaphobranchus kaupii]|uniref:Uncharacterized protein n=1 Tax=Synaphobranchus kaupii TaxID=118154 RepID=A0A9Q1EK05_SYNKA|nr:hypothetical protein SKAU_G00348120 [Synaphobranchus kaupii]